MRQRRYDQHKNQLLPYLTGRGLAAAADRFRLGYVEPGDADPPKYWHRMAIPYLTPTGIVQIRFRCLKDHSHSAEGCPKYLGDPGADITLFNAHVVLNNPRVLFITEGELDAVAIETIAGYAAVGVPGAQAWNRYPYWSRCFVGFDRLIVAADGDDAGGQLAAAVARALPHAHVVQLPDGEDANSVLARDPAEFARRCGLG